MPNTKSHLGGSGATERDALVTPDAGPSLATGGPAGYTRALVVLRTFLGVVYLSNGLAKVFGFHNVSILFWKFYLINRPDALGIQKANSAASPGFIRDVGNFVVDNWSVFQWLLTVGEVAVGIALILGLLSRITAIGGLGLALAPFIFTFGSHLWAYDYLFEPILFITLITAGVLPRLDKVLPSTRRPHQPG